MVWKFSTISSLLIIFYYILCISLIISFLLSEYFRVDRQNSLHQCSALGKYSSLYVFYNLGRIHLIFKFIILIWKRSQKVRKRGKVE